MTMRLYLWLEKCGILRRNDRLTLLLDELDVQARKVAKSMGLVIVLVVSSPFLLLFVAVMLPIQAFARLRDRWELLTGRFRPRGVLAFAEWWEWEKMKQEEAKRLGKEELTARDEQALYEAQQRKIKQAWMRRREKWKRNWRERLGLRPPP